MTLLYPWFLLASFAIAIPIVIHFFEMRKPQLVHFTNISFVKEVKLITSSQRKLKHILILLSRIGFVSFLVLMFCQPFIPSIKEDNKEGAFVSMLVDSSPSMQALGTKEQSIFDQAIKEAIDLSTSYPVSTQFYLGGTTKPLAKAAIRSAVEQLAISGQSKTLTNSLSKPLYRTEKGQTFIFSDFQKNDFNSALLNQFDSTHQVFLVPLFGENTANVYVDSVAIDDAFVRRGADISLRIRLRNGGSVVATDSQVKLFIGDKQAATYRVTIEPNNTATSTVRIRLTNGDLQQCRVEVDDFPISFDNVYHFALQPSSPVRVIDFAAGGSATQRLYANEALFSYTNISPQKVNYGLLESANVVLIQQPSIDAGLRSSVKKLVERGGSVVIVPPAAAAGRASYTQLLKDLGIGSVQWNAVPAGTPTLREVATPSPQNPFFREVFASQSRQTVMPKVAPVLRWSRSETDILRLQDGEGFLASFTSGRGTVYLFSAPFEESYSDFTNHALFVPVMYRLAMQSFRNDQQLAYRMSQQTIAVGVPEGSDNTEQVFKLTRDSLTFIPSQRLQAGTLRIDLPPGMQVPGFYQLTLNGRVIKTLAFNISKQESELARYSADELRSMIGTNHPNIQVYEPSATQSVAAQYRAERVGTPLWQYCLWAALLCLLAEVLLLRFMTSRKANERVLVTT